MWRVPGQRVGASGEAPPKIGIILKSQSESADRSDALGDAGGSDGAGKMECICRHEIQRQQLPGESELADELCQPFPRAGAPKQRGGTLESLHSSSVAGPAISSYIV